MSDEVKKDCILIVDDEKGLRIGTQRLLEDEGYEVETADCGEEGIRLGKSKEFDIAVIDLRMPDIDGLEVLKEIKNTFPNTICFIATAYASYETAIQSTRLGAFSYIPKPFTPEELIYQVELGIKQRKLILEALKLKQEREEQLLELASEKSRLNTIIKAISDGVLVINKNIELVYFNYAALRFLNIQDVKIGQSVVEKLPPEISEIIDKIIAKEKILLKTYTTQIEILPNNELIIEAACTPVPNPDGSLAGVVIILSNITQFKKIEQIKSQFVSMVAHELKTPLAAVQGFINIILNDSLGVDREKQKEYLSRSTVRLKSLTDLVNDLLDISRMELKTKQREIEDVDITEALKSTLQFLEFEIKKKEILIDTHIEENLPTIKADVSEITRLFTNLISNAIKYNKESGSIYIIAHQENNYVCIKIRDTGIGMKPEEKDRLFSEFYRAKNEKTRGISGTGLGLSIVKKIVESYYGKIEVESVFGYGTTFTIHLPINQN
ncbi:MAG: hybrid sensor histidine kinase/response regulator [Stygiobacter sp. RIFOXYC12_FULL_38_8]|nr:MAG: hybrid sensor histidine kinase/response regulator [Stygiobacter sp. GWC2_38_9]OGU78335.1 MAG: hybrid sensor histidine kinase/response regulator [Stygiobacter sp. RIFOXYA12_FULL_38_9]OGV06022.1 MAG: hybrid sensor histidine kinase/response regulator [Stygiobacter sp. RIFOXYB2_FULL_37_11]OGV16915.1 MAG: hybrid sensor histidine kinase/response regulator [Stygiobacter sp. RIFOXYC2_FULL_38_25]OGV28250.1 MAG: hybrid sensor histidine kinase/response regulator [Stygiobacter sp. RIFOXYC12_FULL_38